MFTHLSIVRCQQMALFSLLACTPAFAAAADQVPSGHAPARAALNRLPLTFERNVGQTDKQVNFLSRGAGYTLFLTPTQAVMSLRHAAPASSKLAGHCNPPSAAPAPTTSSSVALHMTLRHSNPHATATGEAKQAGICNYFRGNDPAKWRTNVATFGRVRYTNVYKGVDLLYYGSAGQQTLEYDFVVKPHQDYRQIALQFAGAKRVSVTKAGDLQLTLAGGSVVWKKPLTYQTDTAGKRHTVASRYVLDSKDKTVRFAVGKYDKSRTLVLDPFLTYSTYLGGSGGEDAGDVTLDRAGNTYVTGETTSTNFPVTPGAPITTWQGGRDIFVAKMNAAGTALVYSTYLGGLDFDYGERITLDSAGNAYITGLTYATDFPVTPGAFQTGSLNAMTPHAYVTKLNTTGTALVYSTYLGGDGDDESFGIVVDSAGNAYVAGYTFSTNFPVTANALQKKLNGRQDVFFTKLNSTGTALLYSTYFGGSGFDRANGLSLDSTGNIYITGYTNSTDFPITPNAIQTKFGNGKSGHVDAFVTKFNAAGTALVYSTYLGGSGKAGDFGRSIVLDSVGCAYIAGWTDSADFPTTPDAVQTKYSGGDYFGDAFVTKLNASGTALVYSTYLGGSGDDVAAGLALDSMGQAYVIGITYSANFPVTANTFQTNLNGVNCTAFLTRLNAAGTALVYSTYLGGSGGGNGYDFGTSLVLDSKGNATLIGHIDHTDFPVTVKAYSTVTDGEDVFIVKTGTTEYDLAGDNRTALLLQNSTDNSVAAWFVTPTANGATLTTPSYITTSVPTDWKLVGQADFNGEGHTDLLWQNETTGDVAVWFMHGIAYQGSILLASGVNPWRVAGVGDLNGDGKPDLLWRNMVTGDIACWFLKGTSYVSAAILEDNVPLSFRLIGMADVSKGAQLDLVFQDSGTHNVYVQYLIGTTLIGKPAQIGPNLAAQYQAQAVADLNQDGWPDIVFQNTTTGEYDYWLLRNTALMGTGMIASGVPLNWSIVAP